MIDASEIATARRARLRRRALLAAGGLCCLGGPCLSGALCVRESRPVAEALQRGGPGPHGLPGCSPPIAWALAPIQREVVGKTMLYCAMSFGSIALGLALFAAALLAHRAGRRRR